MHLIKLHKEDSVYIEEGVYLVSVANPSMYLDYICIEDISKEDLAGSVCVAKESKILMSNNFLYVLLGSGEADSIYLDDSWYCALFTEEEKTILTLSGAIF